VRPRLLAPALLALAVAGCGASDTPSGRDDGAGSGQVAISTAGWETDFDKHNVPLSEFQSGGPGRDGIPPVDEPKPVGQEQAEEFLDDKEPVLVAEAGGDARAYPVQILIWHEIVNDDLAGRPIAVTYCPLCNSSLVFDRRVEGETLTFGTTGNLRNSDLVMWDRQTESWWQQLTGEAVVGALTGTKLEALPSQTLSWSDFKERYPDGDVLSRDTGHDRDYGANPYEGYDTADQQPFLLDGEADRRLPPKERVAAAFVGDEVAVVPFPRLARERVVNAEVGGRPLVFLFKPGVRSALDAGAINDSKDVGTAAAFERTLDGRELDLRAEGDGFVDREGGSRFDITGRAVSGPLEGRRLPQVRHDQQCWFALAAFVPDARILD